MTPQRLELAPRSDGARYRRVSLAVDRSGALTLDVHDVAATDGWGLDDEDVTLSIAPEQVGRLAVALAAEILKGGAGGVRQLAEICEAHDVPCRIASWG